MPLTRDHVASRIMVPSYVVLCAAYGIVYVTDPGSRISGIGALSFQQRLMPMPMWGVVMLTVAAVMLTALLAGSRDLFTFALAFCAAVWFLWGCLYAVSVVTDPHVSVLAPVTSWFVACACVASMRSLLTDET
jgi:hypothetical protein